MPEARLESGQAPGPRQNPTQATNPWPAVAPGPRQNPTRATGLGPVPNPCQEAALGPRRNPVRAPGPEPGLGPAPGPGQALRPGRATEPEPRPGPEPRRAGSREVVPRYSPKNSCGQVVRSRPVRQPDPDEQSDGAHIATPQPRLCPAKATRSAPAAWRVLLRTRPPIRRTLRRGLASRRPRPCCSPLRRAG